MAEAAVPQRCVVALGGGVARGLAHIGVLRGMERDGIEIVGIAGTSMGAIVGALAAQRLDTAEMERLFTGIDWPTVGRVLVRSVVGEAFAELLNELLGSVRIESLPIPYAAVACDIDRGEEVALRTGPVWRAALASASVPGIFDAVVHDGRTLVDGAIMAPVPVDAAVALANAQVIAVNVLRPPSPADRMSFAAASDVGTGTRPTGLAWAERWLRRFRSVARGGDDEGLPGRLEVLLRSLHVAQYRLAAAACRGVVTLEPEVGGFGWFDFGRVRELVAAGERAWQRHRLGIASDEEGSRGRPRA